MQPKNESLIGKGKISSSNAKCGKRNLDGIGMRIMVNVDSEAEYGGVKNIIIKTNDSKSNSNCSYSLT